MNFLSQYAYELIIGAVLGYAAFAVIRFLLPKRLRSMHEQQRAVVVEKAQHRKEQLIVESRKRNEEKFARMAEELEASLEEEKLSIESQDTDLALQEQFAEHEEERITKLQGNIQALEKKVNELQAQFQASIDDQVKVRETMQEQLARIADCDPYATKQNLTDGLVNERRLDSQKRIKELIDDLESHSKKGAERVLSRLLSRYQPTFVWPKSVNHVEVLNPRIWDILTSEDSSSTILKDLSELAEGVEMTLSPSTHPMAPNVVRLGGGYGIYKEAARLTMEELLPKGPSQWSKIDKTYVKHKKNLEVEALKLGRRAVQELRLKDVHEEIQKMVGALNWRTSYRQNQFHHSLEVAKLAGLLAAELGVDPVEAKRCGLLHDIGKGIDYRIDGSHAVISGDYADRFGEKRLICDTVMSHHNDLVLDTPLSFVLKSADTLSGARPGARINLEEGYQERLAAMEEAIKSFSGIQKVAIMNGGREVHIGVNHKRIREEDLKDFAAAVARKIEEDVAFPGQIKVLVTRRFEATAVA